MAPSAGTGLLRGPDTTLPNRLALSARTVRNALIPTPKLRDWITERNAAQLHEVQRIPFARLHRWRFDDATGDLAHDSGRFFRIQGLRASSDHGPVPSWTQPIINQPEIGILGILVREIDGVLHCLMQAKTEPGNVNGVQLSPTVQATRSNYTRVHEGSAVPYLEYFRRAEERHVLSDVLQSEQGSWFYRKRNRNMVVEVHEPVPEHEDFRWVTLGQLHELLTEDNLVNMDARTVLSCIPGGFEGTGAGGSEQADTLARSCDPLSGSLHTASEVRSWITSRQSEHLVHADLMPLNAVRQWRRGPGEIHHERHNFFSIIAVDVRSNSREVGGWTQPLLRPHGIGTVAMLVKRVDGVLHALVNARVEPGYLDVVELAPTVQCTPQNYERLEVDYRPPLLDVVLGRTPEQVLFDTELSEEGGRFFQARNHYQIIEVAQDFPDTGLPDFRWLTLWQLTDLLKHSHYVNVQARSLIACLRGLA
ncbi:NDP-hexose 2,3-dehydratase family protein [Saccharopolyspora erythraea]|uniref:NDP-hexose 2,3-dehydratase family protein n=1 Tax=Saccharopolyspora erythraea TaxID=1836 RepID=UPI001BA8EA6F|nr:NDP-hexose 2,3-dehydratase family protein [Saccharopolyspora erythraea]QUH01937.1 NDP-hexose 2,3-dehydratase family protein [Saccharopolyspora erythraea]